MLTRALLLIQTATGAPKEAPAGMGFADFWGLVELAGPLRWPIFATLAIGVWLAIHKLYELLRDRALGRELLALDVRSLDLAQIRERVAAQPEHMLASLQAMMLNAHRTGTSESTLHDEITNFAASQQDLFERFRRRMDFLSDTAGALGLLGTVWGMFEVFFQGTPDRDVILRGMGIALMTTLLGLVVSIILNFATTEIFTFFGSRLQQLSSKADELRFRLLELADPAATGSSGGT
ncbi:MAG: MotA/TolQ/ExbB proton channel family protein, partial [Chloroflexota bacterium]|nr:MotA/TolQ/ExbB proton channel family protein [Chloroflexota bacterium]